MLNEPVSKQQGIARLIADVRSAKVELLSAKCAADRLRMQYSVEDIVSFGDPQALRGAIASAEALSRFFASIEDRMRQAQQAKNPKQS